MVKHGMAMDEGNVIRKTLLEHQVFPDEDGQVHLQELTRVAAENPQHLYRIPPASLWGQALAGLVRMTPRGFLLPEGVVIVAEDGRWVRGANGTEPLPDGWVVEVHERYRVTEVGWRSTLERAARLAAQEVRRRRCLKAYRID